MGKNNNKMENIQQNFLKSGLLMRFVAVKVLSGLRALRDKNLGMTSRFSVRFYN